MKSLALVIALSLSCSVAFQNSVRSDKGNCSTSVGWIASDLLLAGGSVFAASRGFDLTPEPGYVLPAEIMAGVFVASAAIGILKRHNCGRYLDEHPPLAICDGGRRNINNLCYCADGQTWNGQACMGTPLAETCGGGAYAFGPANRSQCFCLDGFRVDNGQCVELQCTGGAFAQVDHCACPNNQVWDNEQCVTPPEPQQQADQGDANASPCPDGAVVGGPFSDQCISCTGGAVPGGLYNQDCLCPEGTASNGTDCVVPQPGAPAPTRRPPPPRHQTVAAPRPPPQAPPAPAASVKYHASYEPAKGAAPLCQVFDESNVIDSIGGRNPTQLRMHACSEWCTGYRMQKLRCQCSQGGC
jgi:hypothetical protein